MSAFLDFSYLVLCEDCLAASVFWFNSTGHVEEMASQVQFWPWHYWKAVGSIAKLYKVFIRRGKISLVNEGFIHICTWNNSDNGWICIYYIKKGKKIDILCNANGKFLR